MRNACILYITSYAGFHDDNSSHTFGVMKKGVYRPLSDFNFEFLMKVKALRSCSTGFLIKVTPERINNDEDDGEEHEGVSSR